MLKSSTEESPITGAESRLLFSETVLGRHLSSYYFDDTIGYIFVADPHWLDEAYSDAIAITDTGILVRNQSNVKRVSTLLRRANLTSATGIDLGAGYGLFVRGMRDAGYNFYWSDKYAENLVARGFNADGNRYDVGVAFEVLEHLVNPASFVSDAVTRYQLHTLFFSAQCFEPTQIPDRDWWYWSFETGQHISFFSRDSLKVIGRGVGMETFYFGGGVYAFSNRDWSAYTRKANLGRKLLGRLKSSKAPTSLTQSDHAFMRDRLRSS